MITDALQVVKKRLTKNGKVPSRKAHKLTQYAECRGVPGGEEACYNKVQQYCIFAVAA